MGADSFQGGVDAGRAGRGELRARVAVQGSNIEALTGDEAFRIPIARCSLARDRDRILVRDEQGSLVIWSDDEGFLDALEKAQRGTLKDQVGRIRRADRRRRRIVLLGKALIVAAALFALSIPVTRWAVRGGVPSSPTGLESPRSSTWISRQGSRLRSSGGSPSSRSSSGPPAPCPDSPSACCSRATPTCTASIYRPT